MSIDIDQANADVIRFELEEDDLKRMSDVVTRMSVTAGVNLVEPGAFTIRNHSFQVNEPGAFAIRNYNFSVSQPGAFTIRNYRFAAARTTAGTGTATNAAR